MYVYVTLSAKTRREVFALKKMCCFVCVCERERERESPCVYADTQLDQRGEE